MIIVKRIEDAVPLVDRIAAEHVELAIDDAEEFLAKIRNAGAVFLGRHTPEVIGDYVGGSNHVLPTARSARFSSGLSVLDFMKRTSVLKLGPEQLRALAPAAIALAKAEGLEAHGRSVADPAEYVGRRGNEREQLRQAGRHRARRIDRPVDARCRA